MPGDRGWGQKVGGGSRKPVQMSDTKCGRGQKVFPGAGAEP